MVEAEKKVSHRSPVPTIRELIQRAVDDGKSYRALEAASGDRVKFQTFQNLNHRPPRNFPKDNKTIEGMAAALEVPEATVVLAYAKGMGLDITTDSLFADLLPRGTDELDVEFQNALVSVVRAAIRMQRGTHHAVPTDPPPLSGTSGQGDPPEEVDRPFRRPGWGKLPPPPVFDPETMAADKRDKQSDDEPDDEEPPETPRDDDEP